MKNTGSIILALFLVLTLLVAGIIPSFAYANNGKWNIGNLPASASSTSIGTIESFGDIFINGKLVQKKQPLYNGDIIQTSTNVSANILLDGIGVISLNKQSVVRVAVVLDKDSNNTEHIFIAALINGAIKGNLIPTARAYIQATGLAFTATRGTTFQARLSAGQTFVSGLVQDQVQRKYFVRPVGLGSTTSVKVRSTRQIQIQVTDENDRPVPDLPVIFVLGSSNNIGSLGSNLSTTFSTTTNAQGIASVPFNAGDLAGTNTITATVTTTGDFWTGEIVVAKKVGFWTMRNTILVSVAVAAAGTATGVAISNSGSKRSDIKPLPPVIKP